MSVLSSAERKRLIDEAVRAANRTIIVQQPAGSAVSGTVELGSTTLAALESTTVVDGGGSLTVDDGGSSITVDGTVGVSGTVAVSGPLTDSQLRATAVPVSLASVPSHAVTGPLTDTQLRASAVPVSLASVPSHAVTNAGTFAVQVTSAPTTAVTGTFWPATQPVSIAAAVPITDNSGSLTVDGTVALDSATISALGGTATAAVTFKGRANTFRTPGRAGTAGQKIFALHNATGSTKVVTINQLAVDLVCTVVKAVTVLPPVIRIHRFTALPTNGTSLAKTARDSSLSSNASVTAWGDASADGTSSATALTVTIPANSMLTQEFAPRLITAAGYEMFDRTVLLEDAQVTLRALEGIVVFLDYTLATQNPTTDMWIVSADWDEA